MTAEGDQISRTEVTEGIVGVSAGDSKKDVKDGYGIVVEKGKPLPEPVKLLPSPEISENLFADNSELHVSWNKLDGATFYRYQLAKDEKFNQVVTDNTTIENTIKMTQLQPGHYYLRIKGVDSNKLQGLDAVNEYEIKQAAIVEAVVEDDSYWKVIMTTGLVVLLLL